MPRPPLLAIVDDDEALLLSLANLLRSHGLRADGFLSAEAFLRSPQRDEVDCVIADVRMPGIDGPSLAREVIATGQRIPFIFVSAYAAHEAHAAAARLGAIAILPKPYREADLLAAIAEALSLLMQDTGIDDPCHELRCTTRAE